jgi:hypothetical protein
MDWTMSYPIMIVIIDFIFVFLLFLSYAIRNNKDEQAEIF